MSDDLIELQRRIDTLSRMLQEDQDELARLRAEVERLTAERDTAKKYMAAYAECDRIGTEAYRDLADQHDALRVEMERLTRKLDGEWNAAIMEAAGIAGNACLVPPDGGSPTEAEVAVCDTAYQRILTLIRIRRKATP